MALIFVAIFIIVYSCGYGIYQGELSVRKQLERRIFEVLPPNSQNIQEIGNNWVTWELDGQTYLSKHKGSASREIIVVIKP